MKAYSKVKTILCIAMFVTEIGYVIGKEVRTAAIEGFVMKSAAREIKKNQQ